MSETATRGTVLVVEDDIDVLDSLVLALQPRGYRVLTARDGARALTLLAAVRVDLILLDLTMPVMSGWEFLEAKCADPLLLGVPVIVVSATRDLLPEDDGEPPWDAVVNKPFQIEILLHAMDRSLARRRRGGGGSPSHRNTPSAGVPT